MRAQAAISSSPSAALVLRPSPPRTAWQRASSRWRARPPGQEDRLWQRTPRECSRRSGVRDQPCARRACGATILGHGTAMPLDRGRGYRSTVQTGLRRDSARRGRSVSRARARPGARRHARRLPAGLDLGVVNTGGRTRSSAAQSARCAGPGRAGRSAHNGHILARGDRGRHTVTSFRVAGHGLRRRSAVRIVRRSPRVAADGQHHEHVPDRARVRTSATTTPAVLRQRTVNAAPAVLGRG